MITLEVATKFHDQRDILAGTFGTTVDVTVTTSAGTSATSSADQYSYVAGPTAYVANYGSGTVTPITVATGTAGTAIAVGANPHAIAITPNGQTAYVANNNAGIVTPITVATNTPGTAITAGSQPNAIAITPNGQTAYVANYNAGTVTPITVATNTPGTAITVGSYPGAIAITPNGQTAYVANYGSGTVTPITVATNTPGTAITVGSYPDAIAITPNGQTAYVANYGSGTVTPINLATNTPGTPIAVGSQPNAIAITPNGQTAYVANYGSGTVTPITVATNTPGTAITAGSQPNAIAITPNGQTAYVANYSSGTVTPITVATNTPGTAITVGSGPSAIAITPDQGPVAAFTVTPGSPGSATTFDGSASGVASGTITNYAWTFGDTTTANTSTPTTTHTYATGGSYTATLTVTDSAGTSTTQVFTGQTVSNNGGSSAQTSQSFTLPPALTAISPNAGPAGGGTVVSITGSGFVPGSTTVQFGATAGTSVSCSSTTSCSATSPAGSPGTVDVTVTTADGTSTTSSADHFTSFAVPAVTAVSPTAGGTAGGDTVTITGTGFVVGSSTVAFGSSPGTSVSCSSTTSCSATSPAESAGTVDVTVTTSGGTSSTSSSDRFSFDATPTVSAVSPVAGPIAGGDTVTITGTGFADATGVSFAGNASSYTIVSDTQITATSPAHAAGTVDITVTNETGTSSTSSSDHFSYDNVPDVTAVSPAAGGTAGGDTVTITGTGFVVGSSTVAFGSSPGTSVSCSSTTSCSATSPAESAGVVDVTVTTPTGTSATVAADQFTYQPIPTLTAISTSPTSSVAFGSPVTMTAALSAGATGSVDFEYSSDGTTYTGVTGCGARTISGTTATCTTTTLPGGTEYLEAVYTGDASYSTSTSAPYAFTVSWAAQTITFTSQPPAAPTVGDTYTISATAPGGPVTFTLDAASSGCSLFGAVVTFTGVGTCVVDATSPASNGYLGATSTQSIVISQSLPGPGLGSIAGVTATAGDRQALVSWSAPSHVSKFQDVSYTVTASPTGATCSTTGALYCLVNGLSDSVSYTFTVAASSEDPTFSSITSRSSSPVTPTATHIESGTTTTPELSPGGAEVISSSGMTTKVGLRVSGDSVIAAGKGLKVAIATSATTGKGTHATVVLITGGTAWLEGSGFLSGSVIDVYALSRGTLLGTAVVRSNGKFGATLRVPTHLATGSHMVQLQGFAISHKRLAIAVGVAVRKSVTMSVVLAKFGICVPGLKASMKTQLSKLAATIRAQGASSVVITGYTFSTGAWARTLVHTQAVGAAEYLRASLKRLGYKRALRIVIRVGRVRSQALSRRVTMAVILG